MLLGKTFTDRQQAGILVIGKDVWTRQQLVEELKCGNFQAAANLTRIVARLDVDSLKQLVSRFSMEDLFRKKDFGITTMFVLMCALEARARDPLEWIDRRPEDLVTLSTEQHRVRKARTA